MYSKKKVSSPFQTQAIQEHVVCVRSDISAILRQLREPMKKMAITQEDIVSVNIRVIRPCKMEE